MFVAVLLLSSCLAPSLPSHAEPYPHSWEVVSTIIDLRDIMAVEVNSVSDSVFIVAGMRLGEWGILNGTYMRSIDVPGAHFIDMDWNDEHRWLAWAMEGMPWEEHPPWRSELAIIQYDGTVLTTLQPEGDLARPANRTVLDLEWCQGTPLLAVAWGDGTVMVYDVSNTTTRLVRRFPMPIDSIEWSPGGSLLAVLSGTEHKDRWINLIDVRENNTWVCNYRPDDVEDVKWHFDGGSLLLRERAKGVVRYFLENGTGERVIDWDVLGIQPSPTDPLCILVKGNLMTVLDVGTRDREVYASAWDLSDAIGWTADGSIFFTKEDRGVIKFWSRIPERPLPTVAITSPGEDAILSGNVTVSGTATSSYPDPGGMVLVKVGDDEWRPATGFGEWNCGFDSALFPDGSLVVRAMAEDPRGGSDIAVRRFRVANSEDPNERPGITIISPVNGADVGTIVHVTGTAADDRGVVSVHYKVDDYSWRNAEITPGPKEIEWEEYIPIFYTDREVRISFRAFDGVHYSEEAVVTVNKTLLDNDENMTVVVEFPSNGEDVPSTFRVSGRVEGPEPETVIMLLQDDTSIVADGTSKWSVDLRDVGRGSLLMRFRAFRDGGYSPWAILSVDVGMGTWPVDHSPRIYLTSPLNGTVLGEDALVNGTAIDDNGVVMVEYRFGDGEWSEVEGTDDWRFTIVVGDHVPGYIWVDVRASDGNSYSSPLRLRYYIDSEEGQDQVEVVEPVVDQVWFVVALLIIIALLITYIFYDRWNRD